MLAGEERRRSWRSMRSTGVPPSCPGWRPASSGVTCCRAGRPLDPDQRAGGAEARAADALDQAVLDAARLHLGGQAVLDLLATGRQAAGRHADVDLVGEPACRAGPPRRGRRARRRGVTASGRAVPIRVAGAGRELAGPSVPTTWPSRTAAGASPQVPRQRAVSNESLPSAVVSPGATPNSPRSRGVAPTGLDVAGRPGADHAGVLPLRLQPEVVVEGRDAVHRRERHAQAAGDVAQRVARRDSRTPAGPSGAPRSARLAVAVPAHGVSRRASACHPTGLWAASVAGSHARAHGYGPAHAWDQAGRRRLPGMDSISPRPIALASRTAPSNVTSGPLPRDLRSGAGAVWHGSAGRTRPEDGRAARRPRPGA